MSHERSAKQERADGTGVFKTVRSEEHIMRQAEEPCHRASGVRPREILRFIGTTEPSRLNVIFNERKNHAAVLQRTDWFCSHLESTKTNQTLVKHRRSPNQAFMSTAHNQNRRLARNSCRRLRLTHTGR